MGCLGNVPLNFKYGGSEAGIGLLVGCGADGAFGMVCSIVMVVKSFYQSGKQEKDYKKK